MIMHLDFQSISQLVFRIRLHKHCVSPTVHTKRSIRKEAFENGAEKSVLYCRFHHVFGRFRADDKAKTYQKLFGFIRKRITGDR